MIRYLLIVAAVVGADQLTKYLIVSTIGMYEMREIIPGFFNLVHVTNKGAAFSLFATIDSPIRHYFFVVVNCAAIIGLTIATHRMRHEHYFYPMAFALIAGGAFGNLIDRLRLGAVTDFLDVNLGFYRWPAFNVADSAICIGVGLLFIANIIDMKKKENRSNP